MKGATKAPGATRFLSYVLAALAAATLTSAALWGALGLFAYIIGLTYAAKQEAYDRIGAAWPLAVLAAPLALNVSKLEITDARIELTDQGTGEVTRLEVVSLVAGNVNTEGESMTLAGKVRAPQALDGNTVELDLDTTLQLDLAANKIHDETELDIRLGHQSREPLAIGRPDWETEFDHVLRAANELGLTKAGVFLCGPEKMARQVKTIARKVSRKSKNRLVFTKEVF